MEKKLRITFIIPFTGITGGIAVVLEYYRQLTAMGHDVNLVYPLLPYRAYLRDRPRWKRFLAQMKLFLFNLRNKQYAVSHFLEDIPVKPVIRINNSSIPDADAVIATAWPTAYDTAKLSPAKGRKFYFIQDYEIWHGQTKRVDNSYRLPLSLITIAPWLTELMKDKFGRDDVTEVRNGIRLDRFYPPGTKNFDQASILMMAHDLECKGTRDGIDALTVVKGRHPDVKIVMFGKCGRPGAPFDFEYHRDPPYEKLLSLYQNAGIFIFPSHREGWGLPPMEAMACKCAVVATNVGCIPVLNNGSNLILVEAQKPESVANGVIKLLEDKALTEITAEQGLTRIREQGWDKSAQTFAGRLSAAGS